MANYKNKLKKTDYYTYILLCENNILYTGITTDYRRRFEEHIDRKGAKFTKSHKPQRIVAIWKTNSRSNASKLESLIKKLDKKCKILLIDDNANFRVFFRNLVRCTDFKRILNFS